jgi:hypothetical protein
MLEDNITHETPFIPHPNDNLALREVKEITTDTPNKYKVTWDGIDPDTRKPWEPSWVSKSDCTDHVVAQWEAKKVKVKSKNVGSGNTRSKLGVAFLVLVLHSHPLLPAIVNKLY